MSSAMGSAPPGWPASRPWEGSGWLSIEQARGALGVRVTDSPYWGAWWAQALRAILYVKGIAYAKVVHPPYRDNEPHAQRALFEWTAQTSVPTMAYRAGEDAEDVIRNDWLGQLMLAERIAPRPSLVPLEASTRVRMIGLASEIMSPQGLMWQGRLAMSDLYRSAQMTEKQRAFFGRGAFLGGKYSYIANGQAPLENVKAGLRLLDAALAENERAGCAFLVGDCLSALDIYWVYASNFASLLAPDDLPIMRFNREMYAGINRALSPLVSARLLAHRDRVLRTYLECPVVVD